MAQLSTYILTYNSEKYLEQVLASVAPVSDEIIVVDSISKDKTKEICQKFNVQFIENPFLDFSSQRQFAQEQCNNDWVLAIDSDEVLNEDLIKALKKLKENQFKLEGESFDAFRLPRDWFAFDQPVHNYYPVRSPDHPIRLYKKSISGFKSSKVVHEEPEGYSTLGIIKEGAILHYSCDSITTMMAKLNQYSSLAAKDYLDRGKKTPNWISCFLHGFHTFIKYYFGKGGWKDGGIGVLLSFYAGLTTTMKYIKLKYYKNI